MSTLNWNFRGLGNPRAVRMLANLIHLKVPQIVFLIETKLTTSEMDKLRSKLGYHISIVLL